MKRKKTNDESLQRDCEIFNVGCTGGGGGMIFNSTLSVRPTFHGKTHKSLFLAESRQLARGSDSFVFFLYVGRYRVCLQKQILISHFIHTFILAAREDVCSLRCVRTNAPHCESLLTMAFMSSSMGYANTTKLCLTSAKRWVCGKVEIWHALGNKPRPTNLTTVGMQFRVPTTVPFVLCKLNSTQILS